MTSTTTQMDPNLLALARFCQQREPCDAMRMYANAPATDELLRPRAPPSQETIELEHEHAIILGRAIESHCTTNGVPQEEQKKKKSRLARTFRFITVLLLCKKKRTSQAATQDPAQNPPVLAPIEVSEESLVASFECTVFPAQHEDHSMPAMPHSPSSSATQDEQGYFSGQNKLPTTSSVISRNLECPHRLESQDSLPEDSPLGLLCRQLSTENMDALQAQPQNRPQPQPAPGKCTPDGDVLEALNKRAEELSLPWSYVYSEGGDLIRRPAIRRQRRVGHAQAQAKAQAQPATHHQLPDTLSTDTPIPIITLTKPVEEGTDGVAQTLVLFDPTIEADLPLSSSSSSVELSSGSSSGDSSSSGSVYSNEAEFGEDDADVEPFHIEDEHQHQHQDDEQPSEQSAHTEEHTGELPPPPLYLWDWRIESHSAFPSRFNIDSVTAANVDAARLALGAGREAAVPVAEEVDAGFDSGFEADADSSSDATVTPASLGRLAPRRNLGSWFTEVFTRRFWW